MRTQGVVEGSAEDFLEVALGWAYDVALGPLPLKVFVVGGAELVLEHGLRDRLDGFEIGHEDGDSGLDRISVLLPETEVLGLGEASAQHVGVLDNGADGTM